jgi:hypothetical protein
MRDGCDPEPVLFGTLPAGSRGECGIVDPPQQPTSQVWVIPLAHQRSG